MQYFVIFAVALSAVHADSMSMMEQKQMLMGVAQVCKATENASDEDIGKVLSKKLPTTKEGKCFFACIMEQMDVIQDGKLSKEGFIEFASIVTEGDAGKMKVAEELLNECGNIKDDDRCELAFKACSCIKMGGMKRKIDFGF